MTDMTNVCQIDALSEVKIPNGPVRCAKLMIPKYKTNWQVPRQSGKVVWLPVGGQSMFDAMIE